MLHALENSQYGKLTTTERYTYFYCLKLILNPINPFHALIPAFWQEQIEPEDTRRH